MLRFPPKIPPMRPLLFILLASALVHAAEPVPSSMTITVSNELDIARPSATIAVPWSAVAKALPGALLQHIDVKDAEGKSLPYQVINVAPEAKDPLLTGTSYGDLVFQHDFAAGERAATFSIVRTEAMAPVFPARVFARYVPERLDDFAWENDRIAHRTYGSALSAPAAPGSGKEVLVSSGLDIWCKRVGYPVIDRWYNKGHNHYHKDEGEGMDMYQTGASRGCGGTGIWLNGKLYVSGNYKTWKVIANGPIRAIFELGYDVWDADGIRVTETKCFTVDAGHNLDQIESTFNVISGTSPELTVGIGLNKDSSDKRQEPKTELTTVSADGSLALWVDQKSNGSIGTAVIVPEGFLGFAEDKENQLVLAKAAPGRPLRYYAGAGWSRAGVFTTRKQWDDYVASEVAAIRSPLRVSVSQAP